MRIATPDDIDAVTDTIALAFADDPVWGPALAQLDDTRPFWRHFTEGAIPHGTLFISDGGEAIALWIPPGADEMSEQAVEQLTAIVERSLDADGQDVMSALWERFDAARPEAPHFYLSLLGTRPERRGHGIAQALVRENLADFDAQGVPAYLESTNPGNDHRYERLGFVKIGAFEGSVPGSVVSTMWRDVP